MHGKVDLAQPTRALGPGDQPPGRARRQDGGDLLDPRLEMLGDLQRLVLLRSNLAPYARQPFGRGLGLGDADHVLERHAHRQVPRRLAQQLGRAKGMHGIEPVEVERGIGLVLVCRKAANALLHDIEAGRRKRPACALE